MMTQMTQSDVLELAKQGNPQAIASLMNLVLQPKGVTVKATLQERCLHILFASEDPLIQPSLVSFAQAGITNLKPAQVEQVKLYAQKPGQKTPLWTDEFRIGQAAVSASPGIAQPSAARPSSPSEVDTTLLSLTSRFQPVDAAELAEEPLELAEEETSPVVVAPPRMPKRRVKPQKKNLKYYVRKLAYQVQHGNRYVLIGVTALGAFAIGGTLAILIYSQVTRDVQGSTDALAGNTVPSGNFLMQGDKVSIENQQYEAKNYLLQMNKAQQKFYQQNNRFATNLEELERSASLISQSSAYTYKLIFPDETQSVVTAVPKADNLKSYAGTVVLTKATTKDWPTSEIVCETNKPSTVAPLLPTALDGPIQCPSDATAIH